MAGTRAAGNNSMKKRCLIIATFVLFVLAFFAGLDLSLAIETGAVQKLEGEISPKETNLYRIPGLRRGQTLYVFMEDPDGILDPLVALLKPEVNNASVLAEYVHPLEAAIAAGGDPLLSVTEMFDKISLIWNDDYKGRYRAAFKYKITKKGDYTVLARSTFSRNTAGRFRILVGVDAPSVLKGKAKPAGRHFVRDERGDETGGKGISSTKGTISKDRDFRFHFLNGISPGETLFAYVEVTSGDLKPVMTLVDFSDKPVMTANYSGQESRAALEYTFERPGKNYYLKISGRQPDGTVSEGEYRLLVGAGAPEVKLGTGIETARHVLKEPLTVHVGVRMHQITNVDQKNENYGVVATLLMQWHDPARAFNPEVVGDRLKLYMGDDFNQTRTTEGINWPEFTISNQQGNRWVQNRIGAVSSDGSALYLERFTTTLQAPDFDFRKFPFDTQQFFISVDALFPEWYFIFEPIEGYSRAGEQLGEEEWLVTSSDTSITRAETAGRPVSRFNFRFEAKRHMEYYIFRILLPILIILLVSWVVFFLKDYGKRIDVAGGNLLLFIAFNFTISNDLPRLGYLTFMDAIMISAFVVSALVLILSVYLKRIAESGKEELAQKIDRYVVRWLYPVAYIIAVTTVTKLFG